ncbi:uncharacterized protein LOC129710949 [Leucoraja erinacea]|uniref:uncharacterized protein LOC129710949 n=1 Tax=Leucoraja erinaceus TaxID=7782 RepID=UPI002454ADF5|nr:uncharacterized protein LOC129710949 [Leucoraja erinacea]
MKNNDLLGYPCGGEKNNTQQERTQHLRGNPEINKERRAQQTQPETSHCLQDSQNTQRERSAHETNQERRAQETQPETSHCLQDSQDTQRERSAHETNQERRAQETQPETSQCLQDRQGRQRERSAHEMQQKTTQRLREKCERKEERRNKETQPERTQRLRNQREREQERRTQETEPERRQRLRNRREREQERRTRETEQERSQHVRNKGEREQERRTQETEPERRQRLRNRREREQERRTRETEQERSQHVRNKGEREQERRTQETEPEKSQRLRNKREREQERRTQEMQQETTQHLEEHQERIQMRRDSEMGDERTRRLDEQRNARHIRRNINADVGQMTNVCLHCRAKHFSAETTNFCCMKGKVNIAPLKTLPNALLNLYTGDTPQAHEFQKNIRQYNCLFQFTSFGAKEVVSHGWNPSVIIQGQIHHFIGSLMPDQDQQSKFLQIYFMDPQDSIGLRMSILQDAGIQRDTVEMLENMIRLNNPYIHSLVMAMERIRDLPEASIVIDPNYRPPFQHERRFNTQTANEVAVIIASSNEPVATSHHIVLRRRGRGGAEGGLQIISESHRSYDSFQYILFFPLGDDGWHSQLQMSTGRKLTLMQYYAYRIMNRDNEFNQLLRGGGLFQQYLVDMAAKMEGDRLNYFRMNQVSLRSTTYKGLTDALHDDDDLENIGRRIVLSSTFVGGPRYMMGRCQDAMMYVRKYGTAAFFITMTCNPNWSEIRQCLFPNQQPSDRPELIARVFELKRKIFMKTVTGPDGFFGNCIAFILTMEYQKRGLPHFHCLLWLDEASKPRPQQYERFVQAEIPDPQADPELHKLVLKHMIHGPFCKATSRCWKEGRCTKRFPKPFVESTMYGDDSYPLCRRRSPAMGGFQGHQEGRSFRLLLLIGLCPIMQNY